MEFKQKGFVALRDDGTIQQHMVESHYAVFPSKTDAQICTMGDIVPCTITYEI